MKNHGFSDSYQDFPRFLEKSECQSHPPPKVLCRPNFGARGGALFRRAGRSICRSWLGPVGNEAAHGPDRSQLGDYGNIRNCRSATIRSQIRNMKVKVNVRNR